jgi:uncharacterized protein with PQ loop repeat
MRRPCGGSRSVRPNTVLDVAAWATGVALIAVELARSVPAVQKIRRHKSSDGVSPESIGILAGSGAGWAALAWLLEAWPLLIATVLWFVLHLWICQSVWQVSPDKRKRMLQAFAVTVVAFTGATAALVPWLGVTAALGITIGVATVLDSTPALVEGLRSTTTRGLSIRSLSVNTAEGVVYLFIGFGLVVTASSHGNLIGYILYGGISIAANIPRLVRVMYRRRNGLE